MTTLESQLGKLSERWCSVCDRLLAQLDGSKLIVLTFSASCFRWASSGNQSYLALMECLSFNLPLLFKTIHNILVTPTNFVRETL